MAQTQVLPSADSLTRGMAWAAGAAILGFALSAIFSSALRWERGLFLVPYVLLVTTFFIAFFRSGGFSAREFTRNWHMGILGAGAIGYFVVQNVFSQPASAVPEGAALIWALAWFGLVYGFADALLLNVLPVLAAHGPRFDERAPNWRHRLFRGLIAIVLSIIVAAAYHFGFAEFRNASLLFPLFGNAIITAGYVLTRSPIAAIGAHVAMHLASVMHGMETVVQLPPHY
jgi:hypothetical protein